MDRPFENQHYVSQVLQRRFANGKFIERFDLRWNKWKKVSTKRIFASVAYSELFAYGTYDNTLDKTFKTYEDALPDTLRALDETAMRTNTALPGDMSNKLFGYCAILWRMSPFIKAIARLEFAVQLDLDLQHKRTHLLEILGIKQEDIVTIRLLFAQGMKFIPVWDLQSLYRVQANLKCQELYQTLRHHCTWTLYTSPVMLPISDTPFFNFNERGVPLYIFTISPSLVLIGKHPHGPHSPNLVVTIKTSTLEVESAEYLRGTICAAALTAVACKSRSIDVLAARKRAHEKGVQFPVLRNLEAVFSAGLKECTQVPRILPVTEAEFDKFKSSFVEKQLESK
jgi:hypothetical protein